MGWFWKRAQAQAQGRSGPMSGEDLLRAAMLAWRRQEGLALMFGDCRSGDRSWPLLLELYIALVCGHGIPTGATASNEAPVHGADDLAAQRLVRTGLAEHAENSRGEPVLMLTQDGRRRVEAYLAAFCRSTGEIDDAIVHENAMRAFQARFRFEPEGERTAPIRRRG